MVRSDRFGERVMFAGNLDKNDLSFTLSDVQLEDEGVYNCYVRNPPDRIKGHGVIQLNVVTKRKMLTFLPFDTLPDFVIAHISIPQTFKFSSLLPNIQALFGAKPKSGSAFLREGYYVSSRADLNVSKLLLLPW